MAGPWEAYQTSAPAEGPWTAFQAAPEAPAAASAPAAAEPPRSFALPPGAPPRELRAQRTYGGRASEPGVGATAAASLATDPEQRRRIYARQMFPDLPLPEALSRIEIGANGTLYVSQPEGPGMRIEPQTPHPSVPGSFNPGNVLRFLAGGAGAALPFTGGVLGGLAAAPTSLVAGPLAAGAGAAAGDAARQNLAGYFDPGTQPYNWRQTAQEAGAAALGQAVGALINRARTPNPLRLPERDIGSVARNPSVLAETRGTQQAASATGVDLSAGQASGLPSLLTLEDAALRNPNTMDQARQFYQRQGQQLQQAGQNALAGISPQGNITIAGQNFSTAADDVIRDTRRAANAQARLAYQAAEAQGQTVTQGLVDLVDNPAVQEAMARARTTARLQTGGALSPADDFRLWDLTRRELRDVASQALLNGDRTRAAAYEDVLSRLSGELDAAFPTYPQARAAVAPGQALASALEETATGRVAGAGSDSRARQILAPIFERSNPQYVAQARDAFLAAGRGDEWYAGARAYLQDAIARASTSQAGLNPAALRRQIWANMEDGVRANMQAALTPQQFAGFNNFMRAVEATARTFPENSMTVQRLGGQEALRQAGEDGANRMLRGLGDLMSPEAFNMVRRGLGSVADWRNGRNVEAVINNLFSEQGVQFLEQMARVSPTSRRGLVMTGQFLAGPGASAASERQPTPPQ